MKIVTPPQINGIDELLDLIINPGKMASLMQQLKEMKDAVAASCDTYNTKSQADDYLAQAQSAKALADAALSDAKKILEKAHDDAERETDALNEHKAKLLAMDQAQNQKAKDLKHFERSLDERGKALATRADQLDAREAALTEATAALVRKQAMLDAEVKKMSDRIAAFHAVN